MARYMTTGGYPPPIMRDPINVQRRGLSAEMIMSKQNNGGPAFPYSGIHKGEKENYIVDSHGMTLRDYMAAKAIQGWLASGHDDNRHPAVAGNADEVAMNAYQMADAMLRAREAS